jgi:hypothetical protein
VYDMATSFPAMPLQAKYCPHRGSSLSSETELLALHFKELLIFILISLQPPPLDVSQHAWGHYRSILCFSGTHSVWFIQHNSCVLVIHGNQAWLAHSGIFQTCPCMPKLWDKHSSLLLLTSAISMRPYSLHGLRDS